MRLSPPACIYEESNEALPDHLRKPQDLLAKVCVVRAFTVRSVSSHGAILPWEIPADWQFYLQCTNCTIRKEVCNVTAETQELDACKSCVTCRLSCLDEELLLLRDREDIFCDMAELRSSEPISLQTGQHSYGWSIRTIPLLRKEGVEMGSGGGGWRERRL